MLTRILDDLCAVIGLFFLVISCVLLLTGAKPTTTELDLNRIAGGAMLVFSMLMLGVSFARTRKPSRQGNP